MGKPIKTVLVMHDRQQLVTRAFRAVGDIAYSVSVATCSGDFPVWHIPQSPCEVLALLRMVERHDVVFVQADDGSPHALIPACIDLVVICGADWVPGTILWHKAKALGAAVAMLMHPGVEYRSIKSPVQHVGDRALYLHGVPALHYGFSYKIADIAAEMAAQWG